jgi:hypothetical protein
MKFCVTLLKVTVWYCKVLLKLVDTWALAAVLLYRCIVVWTIF